MWTIICIAVFIGVLAHKGRVGPFVWDPHWRSRRALASGLEAAPAASSTDSAERILAHRLAEGDLTTDQYYERLSLIQAR